MVTNGGEKELPEGMEGVQKNFSGGEKREEEAPIRDEKLLHHRGVWK